MDTRRVFRRLGFWLCAASVPGCGAHLHNESRHALAKEAQAAFNTAELTSSFDAELEATEALSDAERQVAQRHAIALFDTKLLDILEGPDKKRSWDKLRAAIQTRCRELDSSSTGTCQSQLLGAEEAVAEEHRRVEQKRRDYFILAAARKLKEAKCDDEGRATNPPPKGVADLNTTHQDLDDACEALHDAKATLAKAQAGHTGLISATRKAIDAANKFESDTAAKLRTLKEAYEKAKEEHDATLAGPSKVEEKENAREAIAKALSDYSSVKGAAAVAGSAGLIDVSDLSLIGELDKIEEQLKLADTALKAVEEGGADSASFTDEQRLAVVGLTTIDAVADVVALGKHDSQWDVPGPSVLLMTAEKLSNDAAYLERKIERANAKRDFLRDQLEAAMTELRFLVEAGREYDMLVSPPPAGSKRVDCRPLSSLAEDFEKFAQPDGKKACARYTVSALVAFGNASVHGKAEIVDAQYRLIGLEHLAAVDASQSALRQWQTLLEVPLAQLVAFQAAGITADDVYQLLNVVGLGVIAGGVFK